MSLYPRIQTISPSTDNTKTPTGLLYLNGIQIIEYRYFLAYRVCILKISEIFQEIILGSRLRIAVVLGNINLVVYKIILVVLMSVEK